MREKLIELLDEIQRFGAGYTDFELYGMRVPDEVFNNEVADHLIANGVTIPTRCKDCKKEWCYLRQELGPEGFCSAGERKTNG